LLVWERFFPPNPPTSRRDWRFDWRNAKLTRVLTKDEARSIAREYLDALRSPVEVVILDEHTREEAFGWVFFYQSAAYLESNEVSDMLAGNAPLVVLRDSGELHVTGTALPVESYMERFRDPRRVSQAASQAAAFYRGVRAYMNARRAWWFPATVVAFIVFNAVAAWRAYRYYHWLLDSCEDENEYTGGSGLDCLEPYNWPYIYMMGFLWFCAAVFLAGAMVVAYRHRRGPDITKPS